MGDRPRARLHIVGRLCGPKYPVYWRCPSCHETNISWSDWVDVSMLLRGVRCHDGCRSCGQPVSVGDLQIYEGCRRGGDDGQGGTSRQCIR